MIVWTILALVLSVAALAWAVNLQKQIMREDEGNETMKGIARQIQDGAMAFLKTEYKWLSLFVIIVAAVMFAVPALGWQTAVAFICGAAASGLAGWIGMHTATRAAVRTTQAARTSLSRALEIAFSSGTVMGLCVVGLGLGGLTVFTMLYGDSEAQLEKVLGFSFGASSIALFARVGGGIYTKAADVGADLVGKVEAGIPEDDPRNPAVIADNVGDNVGDVAGMGADLFESYVGSILATMIMGAVLHEMAAGQFSELLIVYPIALASVGIIASVIGAMLVKTDDESKLGHALHSGLLAASGIVIVLMAIVTLLAGPAVYQNVGGTVTEVYGPWSIFLSMVIGLVVGVAIGKVTEYYTSEKKRPVREIAEAVETGPATNIIHGLATGMASTAHPDDPDRRSRSSPRYQLAGVYGISHLCGRHALHPGHLARHRRLRPGGRQRRRPRRDGRLPPRSANAPTPWTPTGNTTAAIGKGFAIGSAALTALALFNTFGAKAQPSRRSDLQGLHEPVVVMGLLVGAHAAVPLLSLAMKAVGSGRQQDDRGGPPPVPRDPGLLEGTGRARGRQAASRSPRPARSARWSRPACWRCSRRSRSACSSARPPSAACWPAHSCRAS
jgi:K(+)-stimulated pyrophosphate-energized sodium pump